MPPPRCRDEYDVCAAPPRDTRTFVALSCRLSMLPRAAQEDTAYAVD